MADDLLKSLEFEGKHIEAAVYEAGKAVLFNRVCPSYRRNMVLAGEGFDSWLRRVIDREELPDEVSYAAFTRFYDQELERLYADGGGSHD